MVRADFNDVWMFDAEAGGLATTDGLRKSLVVVGNL